jgi:hypothetical protein
MLVGNREGKVHFIGRGEGGSYFETGLEGIGVTT